MAPRVLVVDHERSVLHLAKKNLASSGMEVVVTTRGREALSIIEISTPDLVVLDLALPDVDSIDLCRLVRRRSRTPLLVLADPKNEVDRYLALEVGADDYIVKPLNPREFTARVRAHVRRWAWRQEDEGVQANSTMLAVGHLTIDLDGYEVTFHGHPLHLTPTEFHLLRVLCQSPGLTLPRSRLLTLATGQQADGNARQVDVHIRSLRLKLEKDPANPQLLQTVRGIGYRLQPASV